MTWRRLNCICELSDILLLQASSAELPQSCLKEVLWNQHCGRANYATGCFAGIPYDASSNSAFLIYFLSVPEKAGRAAQEPWALIGDVMKLFVGVFHPAQPQLWDAFWQWTMDGGSLSLSASTHSLYNSILQIHTINVWKKNERSYPGSRLLTHFFWRFESETRRYLYILNVFPAWHYEA